MNVTSYKTDRRVRIALLDILLIALMCLLPTASHAVAFPIYKLNPMLLCMLASMLLVRNRSNAFIMAILLPLVPMLVTGMPMPLKAFCMVAEMTTLVAVFSIAEKKMPVFFAALAAILAGKIIYYLLKALLISSTTLVTTEWWIQLATVFVWTGLFATCKTKLNR